MTRWIHLWVHAGVLLAFLGCATVPEVKCGPIKLGGDTGARQSFDLSDGVMLEMVWIPAGSFTMGSPASDAMNYGGELQHCVTLTKGYWIGKCEVTQAQWKQVMGSNSSRFKGRELPVENVTWNECKKFIEKLNAALSAEDGGFRLPSEAEWEYACRAGTSGRYFFGDDESKIGEYAWFNGNAGDKTHPVGTRRANNFGLYDMIGNVWEWCEDWDGRYPSCDVTDPSGVPMGTGRVIRGGGFLANTQLCRSAKRGRWGQDEGNYNLGFRVARTSPAIK